MSSKGYHWYNNGVIQVNSLECPEGFVKGMLKSSKNKALNTYFENKNLGKYENIKKEQSKRMIELNKKKSEEYKKTFNIILERISKDELYQKYIIENMRYEDLLKYYNITGYSFDKVLKYYNISKSKKQSILLSKETNYQKYGSKEEYDLHIKEATEKTIIKKYGSLENYNKIKSNHLKETIKLNDSLKKAYDTKKKNNSFNSSNIEKEFYNLLLNKFEVNDIITQYKESRYPFACDFYIKSLDLFIELNIHWTHGRKSFDDTSIEDLKLLEEWKVKAEKSKFYQQAIYTWTDLDIRKQNTAKENNLNYISLYNQEDIDTFRREYEF